MKKLLIAMLMLSLLSGCSKAPVFHEEQQMLQDMVDMMQEGSAEISTDDVPFTYEAKLSAQGDGYRFTFKAFDFCVAMNDVRAAAAIIDGRSGAFVSFGFDEDMTWNVIPFQEDEERGYISTFEMQGTLSSLPAQIGVLIQWRDSSEANTYQVSLLMDGEDLISEE